VAHDSVASKQNKNKTSDSDYSRQIFTHKHMTETDTNIAEVEDTDLKGAFFDNINRNNRSIKRDRAIAITEDAKLLYKRNIEDMEMQMKKLNRERVNMLDLSPTSADSLILASDFDSSAFVKKDIELGVKIRNLQITLDIAKESYGKLFGE
jgi:uncharacterized protein YjbI with pentapeptide repeats